MIQKIHAPISVVLVYDHKKRETRPSVIKWDGNLYKVKEIGYHHTLKKGYTLYHVYSVSSDELFFRIVLNTESLSFILEEISDGLPD